MPAPSYSIQRDLAEAEAMSAALVPYVYEHQLYARIGRGASLSGQLPSLTIGGLLLRIGRLRATEGQLSDSQRGGLAEVIQRNDTVLREWRVHYARKLSEEAGSRLRQMMTYLRDCREDMRVCANTYLPEALRRTIVHEIVALMAREKMHSADIDRTVKLVDGGLWRVVKPADFLWAAELKAAYPPDVFWWLYHRPTG